VAQNNYGRPQKQGALGTVRRIVGALGGPGNNEYVPGLVGESSWRDAAPISEWKTTGKIDFGCLELPDDE
jgi:hypothetical protein